MNTQFQGWKRVPSSSPRTIRRCKARLAAAAGLLSLTIFGSGCGVVQALDPTPPVMPPRKSTLAQNNKPTYRPAQNVPAQNPVVAEATEAAPATVAKPAPAEAPAQSRPAPNDASVAVVSPAPAEAPSVEPIAPSTVERALPGTAVTERATTNGALSVEQPEPPEPAMLRPAPIAQISPIVLPPLDPPPIAPATKPAVVAAAPVAVKSPTPEQQPEPRVEPAQEPIQAAPYNPAPQPTITPRPVDPQIQKIRDRVGQVKADLEKGTDVNEKDDYGRTLLQQAALAGEQAVVELLLDWGANVKAVDRQGWTALHWAASSGHPEICELLIACGTPIDSRGFLDETPLYWASVFDRQHTVELLLARGAKVNAADKRGKTPLHAAVEGDARATAAILAAQGADVMARDESGLTPLHQVVFRLRKTLLGLAETESESSASEAGALDRDHQRKLAVVAAREMARLLIARGADVNAATATGVTPLHLAAWDETREIADVLITAGARPGLKDSRGRTAGEYARQRGQSQVLAVISDGR